MNHTIFIPLTEFLNNGGTLHFNRMLFERVPSSPTILEVGQFVQITNEMVEIQSESGNFYALISDLMIEVPCSPIYI